MLFKRKNTPVEEKGAKGVKPGLEKREGVRCGFVRGRDERGAFTPIVTAFVLPIALTIIIAVVEMACAYTSWCSYRNDLALSTDQVEQPWFDLELKNSETPGYMLSEQLARCLRENGFNGSVDVYVDERDLGGVGLNRYRAIAFYAVATDKYLPISAAVFSAEGVDMAVSECDYILAYSSNTAWKPSDTSQCSGKWHLDAGQATSTLTRAADETAPASVQTALKERLDAAQEQAETEAAAEGSI